MAETGKKAKAPAKPGAATAEKSTAPKKTAAKKTAAKTTATVSTNGPAHRPTHQEIAKLAEKYWAERGHADGHAEQDWLRAEQELIKKAS